MPPTPNAIHTITQPLNSSTLLIASAVRTEGTPDLQDLGPKEIKSNEDHTATLLEELYCILKTIPTESPPGSEDIYGLDISIAWGSDDLQWMNGAPDGCIHGHSEVQPTKEDKAKFKRAVEIVNELVEKRA